MNSTEWIIVCLYHKRQNLHNTVINTQIKTIYEIGRNFKDNCELTVQEFIDRLKI